MITYLDVGLIKKKKKDMYQLTHFVRQWWGQLSPISLFFLAIYLFHYYILYFINCGEQIILTVQQSSRYTRTCTRMHGLDYRITNSTQFYFLHLSH